MMEFVNGKDDIPYMKWKITFMFETTNQRMIIYCDDPSETWSEDGQCANHVFFLLFVFGVW